jgi:sugar-specific transcriptional regulator TrmB
MVVSQKVLDALKQIGLNLYERKLWVALLSKGTSTAGELSSLAKVPHSRTYDVLETLADKGFVIVQSTKPIKYVAVIPKEAFERAKKKLREDTKVKIDRMERVEKSSEMKELEKVYKKGFKTVEPAELTGSLKGKKALEEKLESSFKNAKRNISILTTRSGLLELHKNHTDNLKKAAERGVKIRIAVPFGKERIPELEELGKYAEVKNIPEKDISGRFFVFDDAHALMALTDEEVHPEEYLSFWTQSEHVSNKVLGPMFKFLWKNIK